MLNYLLTLVIDNLRGLYYFSKDALITAFVTHSLFIVIPILMEQIKKATDPSAGSIIIGCWAKAR